MGRATIDFGQFRKGFQDPINFVLQKFRHQLENNKLTMLMKKSFAFL